ncbi:sulfite exporter TauE/SafE family protein [Ameyamaea chiangmaiensis]|nr:sulfite exporter TauE/SafE family protein [Ameyamaea chiangmaiensis]MBS4075641.1 sulfite exporter TauE/SafE family protein [Ameyamaea chiangmaiensis]
MQMGAEAGVAAVLCGVVVGLVLGLVGGGGSILAVPLMVYVVGVRDPHVAIGTSALAVAVNALVSLGGHARAGTVKWRCASIFGACGMAGALLGAELGKAVDGQRLLAAFALLMIVVGVLMLRGRRDLGNPGAACNRDNVGKVCACALGTGGLSGFFGIGGGFLIVPGLIACTGMPIRNAIGTSLFAVAVLGLTTALSYALTGLVDWPVAALFIAGGALGSVAGLRLGARLGAQRGLLTTLFAGMIFVVAAYVLFRAV